MASKAKTRELEGDTMTWIRRWREKVGIDGLILMIVIIIGIIVAASLCTTGEEDGGDEGTTGAVVSVERFATGAV